MYRIITNILVIFLIISFSSCKLFDSNSKDDGILGCTDESANNYNPDATKDDGSCDYCTGSSLSSFILITYDGGITWDKKCFNIPVSTIYDISIVDSNNIWVCTSPSMVGQTKAQILHSDNGGYTWTEQYENTAENDFFNYIEFFDENNGIAMGDGKDYYPLFLKTTNGGNTWIKTTTARIGCSGDTWKRLDFVDINNGYFFESGINPQKLYKTSNSGYVWTETTYDNYVSALGFYNENIGITIGYVNYITRTYDGGNSWEKIDLNFEGWGNDVAFHPSDPNQVWISVGDLYFSNDMGMTWERQELFQQTVWKNQQSSLQYSKIWDIYVGETIVFAASNIWHNQPLYYSNFTNGDDWYSIQLPIEDNNELEGVIDGVGDNIIVLPGHYN